MRVSLVLVAALLAVVSSGWGEEPAPKVDGNITAECHMLVLPTKLAIALIPQLSEDATIDKAWEELQAQVASGGAKVAAQMVVKLTAGMRTVAETIEELRYPTEFNPPDLPNNVLNELSKEKVVEVLKNWPLVGITPTTFETRNVGATVEIESGVLDDGKTVSANLVMQHVRFLRFAKYDAGVRASGEHLFIEQPIFHTSKSQLNLQLRSGQRTLIGTHMLTGETEIELFFIRVTTKRAP